MKIIVAAYKVRLLKGLVHLPTLMLLQVVQPAVAVNGDTVVFRVVPAAGTVYIQGVAKNPMAFQ